MSTTAPLRIQGIEVTQATQYYRSAMHLSDPKDRAGDNSARLIAGKPVWVRVYLRSGLPTAIPEIEGTLRVAWSQGVLELAPQPPGTVVAVPEPPPTPPFLYPPDALYKWERRTLEATLNFVIPAVVVCGALKLIVAVESGDGHAAQGTTLVDASLKQHFNFRVIRVGLDLPQPDGSTLVIPPPSLTDFQTTAGLSQELFPVASQAEYKDAGTLSLNQAPGPNGCDGDAGWVALGQALLAAAQADTDFGKPGHLHYGLVSGAAPGGGGCNWGGVAASYEGSPLEGTARVMAHEIGHFFTKHSPCGDPDDVDPGYPAYEPYDPPGTPTASIGEYGLNVSTGQIYPPDSYKDLMSYCPPDVWMSLYQHAACLFHPLLNPEDVCVGYFDPEPTLPRDPKRYIPDPTFPWVVARTRPLISVVASRDETGRLDVSHVFRTISYAYAKGRDTGMTVVLDDDAGSPLVSAPLVEVTASPERESRCGCVSGAARGPRLLHAVLPDVAPGSALRVLEDGEEIWKRKASTAPPRVSSLNVEVVGDRRLEVSWRAKAQRKRSLSFWVRWSSDDGETWNAMSTGIREQRAELDLLGVPEGPVMIEVVAHDGFFSVSSDPERVDVPRQPLSIGILRPWEGQTVGAGRTLRLWAATGGPAEPPEEDAFRWLIDGEEVARGLDAWVVAPGAGEHQCTLEWVADAESGSRSVSFVALSVAEVEHPFRTDSEPQGGTEGTTES